MPMKSSNGVHTPYLRETMARYEPALPRSGTNDWKLDYELFRANCKDWLEANALRDEHDELVEFVEGGEMYRDRTWVCASATRESSFGGNDSLGEEVGHELDHLGDDTHWGVRGQVGLALRFLLDGEETVLLWTRGGTPYALRRRLAEELFDRLYQGHPSDYEDVAWYAREHPDKVEAGEIAKPTPAWLLKLRYSRWRAVQPLLRLLERSWSSDDLSRSDCELATVIRKQGEPPH